MGRDQNTYAKRQREMNKKRKAEDKRTRRQRRKEQGQFRSADAPDLVASADSADLPLRD